MGGQINIAKRQKGEVLCVDSYTSDIRYLQDMDVINEDKSHYFHKSFEESPTFLAPSGYGLIVVDFDTKWIGSIQNYTDSSSFSVAGIMLSLDGVFSSHEPEHLPHKIFEKAWIHGVVDKIDFFDLKNHNQKISKNIKDLGLNTFDKLLDFLRQEYEKSSIRFNSEKKYKKSPPKLEIWSIPFNPKGWTFEDLEVNVSGFLKLADRMLEKNFDLSPFIAQWEEYLLEMDEGNDVYQKGLMAEKVSVALRNEMSEKIPSTLKQTKSHKI